MAHFNGLGAGIGEECGSRRRSPGRAVGKPLLPGDAVQIRDMPEFFGLLGQRLDQMWMGMTERRHRDAGGEVEITLARSVKR